MNVYITSTPGYSKESIKEVTDLLSSVKGEIQFIKDGEPFTQDQLTLSSSKFEDLSQIRLLSFDGLFDLAKTYRKMNTISPNDFVVVISTFANERRWFSATSNKNIFVDADGWEYFTDKDSKFGIASQIVENIFQSLLGIEFDNAHIDPNVHRKSIGCINDMCNEKSEIMLKLRTGYICNSCLIRARNNNISQLAISQIHRLMQLIRDSMMNFDFLQQIIKPEPTIVDAGCNIQIGNSKIDLEDVPKTLFIFYLAHLEGVKVDSLEKGDYKEKLLSIYRKLRKGGKKETIDLLCLPYTNSSSTFQKVKTNTNKSIINLLGKQLSEFYVISNIKGGKSNYYKIKLSREYLNFELDL